MPFGEYEDFDDCTSNNSDKSDPDAYCGSIKNKVEGAKKLSTKIAQLKLKTIKVKMSSEGDVSTSQSQGSPDGPHYTLKKIKRKGFPEGRGTKEKTGKEFIAFKLASKEGKFAKYYLIDGLDTNGNGWGVTDNSIPKNIESFQGMPFVVTAKEWIPDSEYENQYDHPFIPTNRLDMIFAHQEKFRVGDITKVAKDDDGRWYAMIKINPKYASMSLPPFCSPAIYQMNPHEPEGNISEWIGLHLAGLDRDPAYGPRVAIFKGACVGTSGQCMHQFKMAKYNPQRKALGELEETKIKPIEQLKPSGTEDKMCDCDKEKKFKMKKLEGKLKIIQLKQAIKKRRNTY